LIDRLWTAQLDLAVRILIFSLCVSRRDFEFLARLEEKTKQHVSADDVDKRAKSKERNQDQQQDDLRRDRLMKCATANFGEGRGERAMVQIADEQLLHYGQYDEQSEKDK